MRHFSITVRIFFALVFLTIAVAPGTAFSGNQEQYAATIRDFFQYLGTGDTQGILDCLTDPMLSEKKELLERNPNFPQLLIKEYRNAKISIGRIKYINENEIIVDVKIIMRGNSVQQTKFLCRKDAGLWKIAEELRKGFE